MTAHVAGSAPIAAIWTPDPSDPSVEVTIVGWLSGWDEHAGDSLGAIVVTDAGSLETPPLSELTIDAPGGLREQALRGFLGPIGR